MVSSIWFKDELSAAAMYTKTIIRILAGNAGIYPFSAPDDAGGAGFKQEDLASYLVGFNAVFDSIFYICVCLLRGKRFQSVAQYSVCLHRSYLTVNLIPVMYGGESLTAVGREMSGIRLNSMHGRPGIAIIQIKQ